MRERHTIRVSQPPADATADLPLLVRPSSCGLRDMEARLIPVLFGGRAPIFVVYRNMFRVCVLLRKVKR
jgi:hypothetical protein